MAGLSPSWRAGSAPKGGACWGGVELVPSRVGRSTLRQFFLAHLGLDGRSLALWMVIENLGFPSPPSSGHRLWVTYKRGAAPLTEPCPSSVSLTPSQRGCLGNRTSLPLKAWTLAPPVLTKHLAEPLPSGKGELKHIILLFSYWVTLGKPLNFSVTHFPRV